MNKKKYLNSLIYILLGVLSFNLTLTILNYFNLIDYKTLSYLNLIAIIIPLFIGGIYLGKNSKKNGYLEGLKIGITSITIILFFNLVIFNTIFSKNSIIYYAIILVSSVLGSIIGINKKLSSQ